MTQLENAVTLMKDDTFRKWVMSACVVEARNVLLSDTGTEEGYIERQKMALAVLSNPAEIQERVVNIVATDATISGTASTTADLDQDDIISKVSEIWTKLAVAAYGEN